MNAKSLKALRKTVHTLLAGKAPVRQYMPLQPRWIGMPNPVLNADGSPGIPVPVHAGFLPIRNDPQSQRGVYRSVKAQHA